MAKTSTNPLAYVAWTQALLATSGSLYFSEAAGYLPCLLCWYQRIAMYPLVIILAVGILRRDNKVYQYVLPLAIIGALIALYHVLLYYGVFAESEQTCRAGVSCTTEYIEYLGFITIPLLSLGAFLVIIACMVLLWKSVRKSAKK
ncbi:MAG: disulfide oxidoreductase [bacterium]|nr:disulfide oxidoreductase [bacterium]MDZ4248186.1 disulfide oxidoreductase [Patescibacteria group bacterium]